MKNFKTISTSFLLLMCLATGLFFVACGQKKTKRTKNLGVLNNGSGETILNPNLIYGAAAPDLDSIEKASQLTELAEKLLTPMSLVFADELLDQALSEDPHHVKAKFYKKLIAPFLLLEGVVSRGKGPIKAFKGFEENVEHFLKELPNKAFARFLKEGGGEELSSEKDIQQFFVRMYEAYDDLRQYLLEIRRDELSLKLPYTLVHFDNPSLKEEISRCRIFREGATYRLQNCNQENPVRVKLNEADIETVQHMVAGKQMVLVLLTSHSLTGVLNTARLEKDGKGLGGNRGVWEELTDYATFGLLKEQNQLHVIAKMGADAILAFKWVQKYQAELCPKANEADLRKRKDSRPGYLFSDGLCTDQKIMVSNGQSKTAAEFARVVETALNQGLVGIVYRPRGTTHAHNKTTEIKPSALWVTPVEDLRDLGVNFKEDASYESLKDTSAGGVFVNGDVNEVISPRQRNLVELE